MDGCGAAETLRIPQAGARYAPKLPAARRGDAVTRAEKGRSLPAGERLRPRCLIGRSRPALGHQKTRRGRLDALDALVAELDAELLDPAGPFGDAPVVDVGLGAVPWTTVDWFHRLQVPVVGVDHAPDAVQRAQSHAESGLTFVEGGLELPVTGARMVRVLNVLRGGPPDAARRAHDTLGHALLDGGLLLEGSCSPTGDVGSAHRIRKHGDALHRESLLFWLEPSQGDAPFRFRDRLPRDLRGDRAHPVFAMLGAWMDAYRELPAGPSRLADAASRFADLQMLGPHAALWTPPDGVPERGAHEARAKGLR